MTLESFLAFIEHGGFASVLIVVSALMLLLISAERAYQLYYAMSYDSHKTMLAIRELVLTRKYSQAVQVCNRQLSNPELVVVRSGLIAVENGREAMKSALSASLVRITNQCEKRLPYLSLIASGATLLGLLGTISGLIKTFAGLASADAAEKSRLLGSGIAEAMNATAAGLIIGLAAMVVHTICVSRADDLVAKAQSAGLSLWSWVEESERTKING